jgi:hypothetical protein
MRIILSSIAMALALGFPSARTSASELEYPQIVRMRYEAIDLRTGGNFTIWLDRETIRQGLDARLFPGASYVQVSHITPSTGSPPLTIIEVQNVNSVAPEFYHIGGTVRFKVNGMTLKSTNVPR